jgi:C4-dicarboxylate-specific signal transduction histidine kinase
VFDPFFKDYKIEVVLQKTDANPKILGSVSMLEAIVTNFLTNTIHAFDVETEIVQNRKVVIRTVVSDSGIVLSVLDNGPGIKMPVDEVWLPGRTTTPNGTGFGLTIVRDVVSDLDGEAFAVAKGELGGAEFAVRIPYASGENKK